MTEPEETPESTSPPSKAGLVDLSDLRMMPAWVAGMGSSPSTEQQFRRFEGDDTRERRGGDRGDRRGGPPGRGFGGGGGGGGQGRGEGRPPRRDGPPGGGQGGPRRDDRGGPRSFGDRGRGPDRPQREWQEIPKDINVGIEPEDKAAEALANHIRSSGHAFSMFDAARLVLAEGDRFQARFTCAPDRSSGLFVSLTDGGVFLTHDEALQHVLRGGALEAFYRVEELQLEEPKGDFKSIGVCGMTGELLGPPSHHSFQTSLIRMHRERFSHMPLEDYKRRVRVEANPELVAQWKEKQTKGSRWVAIKEEVAEGAEPVTFSSRAEMEAHFRRTYAKDAVHEAKEVVIHGNIDKAKMTHVLFIMLRHAVENARKHLFEMSQKLGGGFERRGLKLFKRRAGKLFVSRVKPHAVDPGVVFSDRVAKIVEVLKTQAGMPLHQLVETIVPSAAPAEGSPPAEGGAAKPQLTDEQIAVIKDVRWLANEGYVIEYSDGMVFLGVQGEPSPAKPAAEKAVPAPKAAEEAVPAVTAETAASPVEALAAEEAPPVEDVTEEPAPPPVEEVAEAAPPVEESAPSSEQAAATETTPVVEPAPAPEAEAEAEAESSPLEEPAVIAPTQEATTPVETVPQPAAEEAPESEATPEAEPEAPAVEEQTPAEPTADISASEEPVPPMGEEPEKTSEV